MKNLALQALALCIVGIWVTSAQTVEPQHKITSRGAMKSLIETDEQTLYDVELAEILGDYFGIKPDAQGGRTYVSPFNPLNHPSVLVVYLHDGKVTPNLLANPGPTGVFQSECTSVLCVWNVLMARLRGKVPQFALYLDDAHEYTHLIGPVLPPDFPQKVASSFATVVSTEGRRRVSVQYEGEEKQVQEVTIPLSEYEPKVPQSIADRVAVELDREKNTVTLSFTDADSLPQSVQSNFTLPFDHQCTALFFSELYLLEESFRSLTEIRQQHSADPQILLLSPYIAIECLKNSVLDADMDPNTVSSGNYVVELLVEHSMSGEVLKKTNGALITVAVDNTERLHHINPTDAVIKITEENVIPISQTQDAVQFRALPEVGVEPIIMRPAPSAAEVQAAASTVPRATVMAATMTSTQREQKAQDTLFYFFVTFAIIVSLSYAVNLTTAIADERDVMLYSKVSATSSG